MPAVIAFLVVAVGLGFAVGAFLFYKIGFEKGKEEEAKKWGKQDDWKREEGVHYGKDEE
jgi:hypothetical protein